MGTQEATAVAARVKRLTTKLNRLGSTPDSIAATLASKGIKGVVKNPFKCPLATYFKNIDKYCMVSCQYIYYVGLTDEEICAKLPPAVKAFVQKVDAGKYPEITCSEKDYNYRAYVKGPKTNARTSQKNNSRRVCSSAGR